ncbi:MAG: glycosyltransferase family 39 protein, partial [Anaerolineae bacterium]|nr:glycosyltransferase family 39 protein [Anaerolineae bacterium]
MLQPTQLQHNLFVILILLIAFALRIVAIADIPAGLSHDEAYNGVTAIETLEGQPRIFYEINKGIEPLIIYLEALAFRAFGIGPVPLRLVNVFAGMVTVALVYPLAARLFNRRVALVAMAGVSVSFWAVFVSRLTLRAVLLPPLLLLTLYLFWLALTFSSQRRQLRQNIASDSEQSSPTPPKRQSRTHFFTLLFFALSGVAAGLSMYTYLSSRFMPLIIITVFGYFVLRRRITRWHWLGLFLHFVILAAMFMPLISYFVDNQASFSRRSDQVTTIPYLLNGELGPTIRNSMRTLGMFTFQGDTTDRYNLDGRPIFDWINGLIFYFGLVLMLWRLSRSLRWAGPAVLLLSSLAFMLLPDFITDDSPHFLRTIGALPFVYIIWAVGLVTLLQWLSRRLIGEKSEPFSLPAPRLAKGIVNSLLLILLVLTTLHTTYDYFVRWANAPEARSIYGADIAAVSRYLKNSDSADLPVISAEYYRDLDPFRLALHFAGSPPFVIWFDGTQTLAFPPAESRLSPRYIFPASAPAAETWNELLEPVTSESSPDFALYRLPESDPLGQLQNDLGRLDVIVHDDLRLLGWSVLGEPIGGGQFQLLLSWQALRALPPGTDYTFLVRMRDSQGHLWLETDGNGYDPDDWQPGVLALQQLTFHLPGDVPPQNYTLSASVVDRRLGQALPASNGEAEIILGDLFIQLPHQPRPINPD